VGVRDFCTSIGWRITKKTQTQDYPPSPHQTAHHKEDTNPRLPSKSTSDIRSQRRHKPNITLQAHIRQQITKKTQTQDCPLSPHQTADHKEDTNSILLSKPTSDSRSQRRHKPKITL
jgi:Spy/CpxP family protein refolding chaperone